MLHSEACERMEMPCLTYNQYRALEWFYMQGEWNNNHEMFEYIRGIYPTTKKRLDFVVRLTQTLDTFKINLR